MNGSVDGTVAMPVLTERGTEIVTEIENPSDAEMAQGRIMVER